MLKPIIIILLTVLLSNCASIGQYREEWIAKHCKTESAYNAGLAAGLTPRTIPDQDYARHCPKNNDALNGVYLKGFSEGARSRPQQLSIVNEQ